MRSCVRPSSITSRTGVVWLAVTASNFASRKTPAILLLVAGSSATTRTLGEWSTTPQATIPV
jgi:hypothetical protein